MQSISDISNIIMAIASVLNLVIVIWIFMKERRDSQNKIKQDNRNFWYNSLGLKELTIVFSKAIDDLKEFSIRFFNDEVDNSQYIENYKVVDNKFLKYKSEYLTIVSCVNDDISSKLTEEFQQIQDDLYELVSVMLGDKSLKSTFNSQNIIINFENLKKKIIKMSVNINV